jgi:type IV pilus assembly protein PilW
MAPTNTARPTAQGFTLIEMTVSLVVTAILVAGGIAVLGQQQRLLQRSSADRAIQETARSALGEMGPNLRRAGFGIEPSIAFDFSTYQCGTAVQCRDSIVGSDEIVFYARDPAFKLQLNAAPAATQLVLAGGIQAPLRRGQILQVMCAAAADWTYVTVSADVPANWILPAAAPATTTVNLVAGTVLLQPNTKLTATGSCFQTDPANTRVYRVDRFRYFVATYTDSGSTLTRPYLMLDRGLLRADGSLQLEPVVPDVEDLQFEYVFVNPVTQVVRAVGATAGTQLTNSATGIDLAAAVPDITSLGSDPTRLTNHPANIRAVRVNVVARSPGPDLTKVRAVTQLVYAEGPSIPASSNRPAITDTSRANDSNFSHHVRIRVESTFETRNLDARAPYFDR